MKITIKTSYGLIAVVECDVSAEMECRNDHLIEWLVEVINLNEIVQLRKDIIDWREELLS